MNKLTKQSPLYDIVKRLNELIEEFTTNKEVYDNFKPVKENGSTKDFLEKDLPVHYAIDVIGIYTLALETVQGSVEVEVYKGDELKNTLVLNQQEKVLESLFFDVDNVLVLRGHNLSQEAKLTITLKQNLLDAFIDQYEANKKNISESKKIAKESKDQFLAIQEEIKNFYGLINFEFADSKDLKALLTILDE